MSHPYADGNGRKHIREREAAPASLCGRRGPLSCKGPGSRKDQARTQR